MSHKLRTYLWHQGHRWDFLPIRVGDPSSGRVLRAQKLLECTTSCSTQTCKKLNNTPLFNALCKDSGGGWEVMRSILDDIDLFAQTLHRTCVCVRLVMQKEEKKVRIKQHIWWEHREDEKTSTNSVMAYNKKTKFYNWMCRPLLVVENNTR